MKTYPELKQRFPMLRVKIHPKVKKHFVPSLAYIPMFFGLSMAAASAGLGGASLTAAIAVFTAWAIPIGTIGLIAAGVGYVFAPQNHFIMEHATRVVIGSAFILGSGTLAALIG